MQNIIGKAVRPIDSEAYEIFRAIQAYEYSEKAILKNVQTFRCSEPDSLKYVLDNLADLVAKEVHGSGGYGMLVGPAANKNELKKFADKLRKNPSNYIAQPTLSLSTVPIFAKKGLAPRHDDLRPFVLVSPDGMNITPGGLTRSKDTESEWKSVLTTSGVRNGYDKKYDAYCASDAIDYLLRDTDNPSSVISSIENARTNARMVRTVLTTEVWEAVNETWMALRKTLKTC